MTCDMLVLRHERLELHHNVVDLGASKLFHIGPGDLDLDLLSFLTSSPFRYFLLYSFCAWSRVIPLSSVVKLAPRASTYSS